MAKNGAPPDGTRPFSRSAASVAPHVR